MNTELTRREFLTRSALATGALALGGASAFAEETQPLGKAEHCIFIWLNGGMSQIDTFDPKPIRGDEKKKAGSYYDLIDTSVPGVSVCEHLPRVAKMFDRFA